MQNLLNKLNKVLLMVYVEIICQRSKVRRKLAENSGNFFTENGLTIVIVVAIAGIVAVAVVALFKDKIFPGLNNKVEDFFAIT